MGSIKQIPLLRDRSKPAEVEAVILDHLESWAGRAGTHLQQLVDDGVLDHDSASYGQACQLLDELAELIEEVEL